MQKEKIKNWLKNPHNLILISIILFGAIIRLYFFSKTGNQPLWWDEADYLAYAKNIAGFPVEWIITEKHNSIYPYIVAVLFKIGSSETFIKFLVQFIPSLLTIPLVYLIATKMYGDRKIGLISSFLFTTLWIHLFNTTRFHLDIMGLFFGLLAIYVFWTGYERKEKIFGKINPFWTIPLAASLSIIAYSIRRGYFLFGLFFIIYILLTKKPKEILSSKSNWLALLISGILLFFSENIIFSSGIESVSQGYFHIENSINFLPFGVFNSYFLSTNSITGSIVLYLFWIGFSIIIINLALSFGHIKNNLEKKSDLFNLISIITTLFFFIYVLRSPENFGEPRWYLPLAFSTFICVSRASKFIMGKLKKYNKNLGILIITLLMLSAGYLQIQHSNILIEDKVNTYDGIKQASLFIKSISEPNDVIITRGMPQVAYYSEREAVDIRRWGTGEIRSENDATLEQTLEKISLNDNVKFILITFSEPGYPSWSRNIEYINLNGQTIPIWEIPFMDTRINLATKEQQIIEEKNFNNITFKLIRAEQEVFVYEILRV